MNTITDLNAGKWRSSYRPENFALADANKHTARLRHRNRPARWCLVRLPQMRSRRIR